MVWRISDDFDQPLPPNPSKGEARRAGKTAGKQAESRRPDNVSREA